MCQDGPLNSEDRENDRRIVVMASRDGEDVENVAGIFTVRWEGTHSTPKGCVM